jgi:hypothetical protein
MAAEDLENLHEAIDRLDGLTVAALGDEELHAAVVAIQRERARLGLLAARLIAGWNGRGIWAGDGSRSAAARLSRDTACSPGRAAVELRRARQASALPATTEAIRRGELSLDHLDLLGRASQPHRAAQFDRDEGVLAEQCTRMRFTQAIRMVQYWCRRADAEAGQTDGAAPPEGVHLHAATTFGDSVVVNGVLDPVGGAAVMNELGRLERELCLTDRRDGRTRSAAQRRAAALVRMAERSAIAPAGGRPAKPLFTVLLGDAAFPDLCELANGTVISPRQLLPWLDAAELETVLFDGPSTVVSVSKRRSFVGAVRRAIEVRDRHCQHPSGCDVPADRCDVDHIVPYSYGGPTSQFNGRLECMTHNRLDDHHDHDAAPLPERMIDRLDELRARLRWRCLHDDRGPPPPSTDDVPERNTHAP